VSATPARAWGAKAVWELPSYMSWTKRRLINSPPSVQAKITAVRHRAHQCPNLCWATRGKDRVRNPVVVRRISAVPDWATHVTRPRKRTRESLMQQVERSTGLDPRYMSPPSVASSPMENRERGTNQAWHNFCGVGRRRGSRIDYMVLYTLIWREGQHSSID
jgi:hypothetical protein